MRSLYICCKQDVVVFPSHISVYGFTRGSDPDFALVLRQKYDAIKPGYHMSKRHWNTVIVDGTIPDNELRMLIDQSYDLVVRGMKKADRVKLGYI